MAVSTIDFLKKNKNSISKWIDKPIPSDLKNIDRNAYDYILTIKAACCLVNWSFSDNYKDWNYWHCVNMSGGVFQYSLEYLLEELERL
jgi:hypothetical protein